jgi:branched-chain amino acid transport system permease protein
METIGYLYSAYQSTLAFGFVYAAMSLSCYAAMSAGILSFGTVAFAAVGGFVGIHLLSSTSLPLAFILPLTAVSGGIAAAFVAVILLRLQSHWMALASLALVLIVRILVLNAPRELTGGVVGMSVPATVPLWVVALVLAVLAVVFHRLTASWYGTAATAVREDPAVAASLGISPRRIQFIATVLSGAVGGVAGLVLAMLLQYVSPETYFVSLAFTMIASLVLGGSYHWAGAIVGAVVFTALPVVMQAVVPEVQDIAKGLVLLVIMIFLPRGLIDPRMIRGWIARRRQHRAAS